MPLMHFLNPAQLYPEHGGDPMGVPVNDTHLSGTGRGGRKSTPTLHTTIPREPWRYYATNVELNA